MIADEQVIERLRTAMADEVRGHRLDRDAALAVATEPPKRSRRVYVAAVAVGVAVVASVAVGYVVSNSDSHPSVKSGGAGCAVDNSVLPTWARAGFTDPTPVMPHVLGDHGKIVAILWSRSHPLNAPPLPSQNNKILWATPYYGGPLVIHAKLGTTEVMRTIATGPGPSTVNMPRAGCWRFDLSWGDNHDTMRLPYDRP